MIQYAIDKWVPLLSSNGEGVPTKVMVDLYMVSSIRYYIDGESDIMSDGVFDRMCKDMLVRKKKYPSTFPDCITDPDLSAGTGFTVTEKDLDEVQQVLLAELRKNWLTR